MSPAGDGGLLLVAADPTLPLGLVHRTLELCAARARAWVRDRKRGAA
jgi:hypothetical protein